MMLRFFQFLVLFSNCFKEYNAQNDEQNPPPPLIARNLQYNEPVVQLNDANFEHQTQASTGQTTGNWLVWFYTIKDGPIDFIVGEMPDQEDFFAAKNIIQASVNGDFAKETSTRFNISTFPTLIYFSKRSMYRYHGELIWEAIREFIESGHVDQGGETVPSVRSDLSKILNQFDEIRVTHLLVVALGFVWIVVFIYNYLKGRQTRKRSDKKKY